MKNQQETEGKLLLVCPFPIVHDLYYCMVEVGGLGIERSLKLIPFGLRSNSHKSQFRRENDCKTISLYLIYRTIQGVDQKKIRLKGKVNSKSTTESESSGLIIFFLLFSFRASHSLFMMQDKNFMPEHISINISFCSLLPFPKLS